MAAKGKDNKAKKDKKVDEPYGYVPPDLCEFIGKRTKEVELPPNTIDEAQKRKFLKQIAELQQRVERCANQMDELSLNLTLYPPKFEKIEADTNDISRYLGDLLARREARYDDLFRIKEQLTEELTQQEKEHQRQMDGVKSDLEDLRNELLPINQKLKADLGEMADVDANKSHMEAIIANYKEELRNKALNHHAEMYEREKETVRELFEIREQIPDWVKNVSEENKIKEQDRIHNILNMYQMELCDLLRNYIGLPNQLARRTIYENEKLKIVMDKNDLNIKLISENMGALKRRGESDIHEIHDLASNVKENKILLKSIESNPMISSKNTSALRAQVQESKVLLIQSKQYFENLKKEINEIISNIKSLDFENYQLQGAIRAFQGDLHKVLKDQPQHEKLLGNLRVASCLEILDDQNEMFADQVCCRMVDPYKIFMAVPVTGPKNP